MLMPTQIVAQVHFLLYAALFLLWCVEPHCHLPHGRLVLLSVPEPQIVQPNLKELICRGIQILEEGVVVRGQP